MCQSVLAVVLEVYRELYTQLRLESAAAARKIYEDNLKAAQADYAAAIAAEQRYLAAQPKSAHFQSSTADPVLTSLEHDVDQASKAVDNARSQIQTIDTQTQQANGMASDLRLIDGPSTVKGLYGIKGLRSDNLKTDAIIWASCLGAALVYVILVAFLDRTIRDPLQIKGRVGRPVVTIPDYVKQPRRRRFWRRPAKQPA
jgi:hypothetical protein